MFCRASIWNQSFQIPFSRLLLFQNSLFFQVKLLVDKNQTATSSFDSGPHGRPRRLLPRTCFPSLSFWQNWIPERDIIYSPGSLCLRQWGRKINVFSAGIFLNFSLLTSSRTLMAISSIRWSSNFNNRAIVLNGEYNKSTTNNINLGNLISFFLAINSPKIRMTINNITIKMAIKTTNWPKNM